MSRSPPRWGAGGRADDIHGYVTARPARWAHRGARRAARASAVAGAHASPRQRPAQPRPRAVVLVGGSPTRRQARAIATGVHRALRESRGAQNAAGPIEAVLDARVLPQCPARRECNSSRIASRSSSRAPYSRPDVALPGQIVLAISKRICRPPPGRSDVDAVAAAWGR